MNKVKNKNNNKKPGRINVNLFSHYDGKYFNTWTLSQLAKSNDYDINRVDKHGDTILSEISKTFDYFAIHTLIEHKADINQKNNMGDTALINVCCSDNKETSERNRIKAFKYLIYCQADVNITNNNGSTALIEICSMNEYHNDCDLIKALIFAKAKVNHKNKLGDTALIKACEKYKYYDDSPIKMLIEARASVNDINANGNTALTTICQAHVMRPEKVQIVKKIISLGACIDLNREHRALKTINSGLDSELFELLIDGYIQDKNYSFIEYFCQHYMVLEYLKDLGHCMHDAVLPKIHKYITEALMIVIDDNSTEMGQSFKNLGDLNIVQIIVDYIA